MSKVTKKVGRAVIKELSNRHGFDELFDAIDKSDMVEIFDEVGRAAIEAMREPTEAMVASGINERLSATEPSGALTSDIWRAMIDEALK